jgi:hypothetical protein
MWLRTIRHPAPFFCAYFTVRLDWIYLVLEGMVFVALGANYTKLKLVI